MGDSGNAFMILAGAGILAVGVGVVIYANRPVPPPPPPAPQQQQQQQQQQIVNAGGGWGYDRVIGGSPYYDPYPIGGVRHGWFNRTPSVHGWSAPRGHPGGGGFHPRPPPPGRRHP
jgi:hypothetical protein